MNHSAREEEWAAWMRAAMAGDTLAYHRFLKAVTPYLRSIARRRCDQFGAPPSEVEDVVQEVLLAVHLKRGTWDTAQPLQPWVYAIARHKVVDAFRRRGRAVHLPVEDFAEALAAEAGPDPFEAADAGRLLARLPERDAALLRCLALEARGHDECGARLGLSPGGLRVALHRALQRLARVRQEEGA